MNEGGTSFSAMNLPLVLDEIKVEMLAYAWKNLQFADGSPEMLECESGVLCGCTRLPKFS
jgi:hypothetical protein